MKFINYPINFHDELDFDFFGCYTDEELQAYRAILSDSWTNGVNSVDVYIGESWFLLSADDLIKAIDRAISIPDKLVEDLSTLKLQCSTINFFQIFLSELEETEPEFETKEAKEAFQKFLNNEL